MYNYAFDAETKRWIDEVAAKLPAKMRYAVEKAQETDFIPYSTQNDEWKPVEIS